MPDELPPPYLWAAVDILVINGSGEVLLVKRRHVPHGWAVPGGLLESGESVAEAGRRELREETGLEAAGIWLKGVSSDPRRDPRGQVVSILVQADLKERSIIRAGSDAAQVGWFLPDRFPRELLLEHRRMVLLAMDSDARLPIA